VGRKSLGKGQFTIKITFGSKALAVWVKEKHGGSEKGIVIVTLQ
jgi:hypothetical protein